MKNRRYFSFLALCMIGFTTSAYAYDESEFPINLFENSCCEDSNEHSENKNLDCNGVAGLEYKHVGGDHGSWVYLVNRSGSRAISVTVRARWMYEGSQREERKVHRLAPGEKKYIGNTRWRNQVFTWDIVGCR